MGASPMPYALCPMPYALCPMPYEHLMLLRKAIVAAIPNSSLDCQRSTIIGVPPEFILLVAPFVVADRPCKAFCSILSKKVSREIPDALAIDESTLFWAKEQYSPASKNQGCPSGSMRKSNKL